MQNYYGMLVAMYLSTLIPIGKTWKCIWITRDRKIVRKLSVLGWPVCYSYSFKAIFLLFRAKLAVYTNNLSDVWQFQLLHLQI